MYSIISRFHFGDCMLIDMFPAWFLLLLSAIKPYCIEACSSSFTDLNVNINVDHSSNVGELIYTLMNGNDARSIVMEASGSGSYGLNPSNDHEIIVTACVFWIGTEILRFKISGDSTWCGSLNFVSSPAIPQFTNPTEIIKIGAISPMEFVDVVQVTFANDHCAEFDCPSVTCTNDASQSFAYFVSTQMIRIQNLSLIYGVTYTIEITCRDTKHSSGTSTQSVTVVFFETAPTTATTTTTTKTTIISTATSTESSNNTPTTPTNTPTTSTVTPSTTTTMPSTTTNTPSTTTITPSTTSTTSSITTTTPSANTTTPSATTTTPSTNTTTPSTTTNTPLTTTITPSTTSTTSTITTTTPTTTTTMPSTTTTTPSTTTITPSTTTTTPSTTTTTSSTTTTTPSTTRTTPSTSRTTPSTITIMHSTTTTTPSTTSTLLSITTNTLSTPTIPPSTTAATPSTTMTTPSTTSTLLSTTTTTLSTPTTNYITTTNIPASTVVNPSTSTNPLAAGIEVSDPEMTNIAAIAAGAAIGGAGLLGLIVFSFCLKFAGTKRISPRSERKPNGEELGPLDRKITDQSY